MAGGPKKFGVLIDPWSRNRISSFRKLLTHVCYLQG